MKILHTADIHLRTTSDERWHSLEAVLAAAGENRADALVISGDLFDRDVDAHRLKTSLRALFDKCPAPVLILPGNHDDRGLRPGDFYGDRVTLLTDTDSPVDIGDVRVVGVPYSEGGVAHTLERLRAAASRVDPARTNIMAFHGELMDLVPGAGAFGDEEADYMPVRLASFDGLGFDYVLAGHFHRGYGVHRYDGGYFVYPGSPVSITVKETGRRHLNVVEPGAAPVALPLDTHHIESVEVRLDPLSGAHPVESIEKRLDGMHPNAEVLLRVSGFVDLGGAGMTETEFHEAVKQLMARHSIRDVDPVWVDVGDVLEHELFLKFESRVAQSDLPRERREELEALMIRCVAELMYAS